jgi:hypothetical protein
MLYLTFSLITSAIKNNIVGKTMHSIYKRGIDIIDIKKFCITYRYSNKIKDDNTVKLGFKEELWTGRFCLF